jgi:DMSO/TMAO reductase YedYZ heme-binding membrane subunit
MDVRTDTGISGRWIVALIAIAVLAIVFLSIVVGPMSPGVILLANVFVLYLAWRFVRAFERIAREDERQGRHAPESGDVER